MNRHVGSNPVTMIMTCMYTHHTPLSSAGAHIGELVTCHTSAVVLYVSFSFLHDCTSKHVYFAVSIGN